MKIEKLNFVFENCECVEIDGKYIGDFLIDDISTCVTRVACNAINELTIADTVKIELHKDANKKYSPFGFKEDEIYAFDRILNYQDITQIFFTLVDDDGENKKQYYYDVHWNEDSNPYSENLNQKSKLSKCGNLYIVISKDKNIDDFFDNESIDDEKYMDFVFDMCDVGDKYGDPNRYDNEDEE